jgi:signal transduction histidine kinase
MKFDFKKLAAKSELRTVAILLVFIVLASTIAFVLFKYTENLLKERLQERLISIVSTASTQIDPVDVKNITSENINNKSLERLVGQLKKIRNANANLRYAYVMRQTEDPLVLEFVADAETLEPIESLDQNEDGILQDDEAAPQPGDPFEISDYPVLRDEAFYHPAVDRDLEEDQWSVQMSAYAPILEEGGKVIAIIGIDVTVDDFLSLTQETFLPFSLFIIFLVLILTLQTLSLVRLWEERVQVMGELDRQKDELLSIVSHQLATPVSSIKWYLEMLQDGDMGELNKDQKEHVGAMRGIGENMSDLVSMILDVSRIQLGRMKIEKQDLDLNVFFHDILATIEPKATEKNVRLHKNIPVSLPVAKLDRRYTNMTIENLLSNAVKYTPSNGEVFFDVAIKDNKLTVVVKDTGMGIPENEKAKIFGRMYRASNARNAVDGNGFGLFVAKGAVEAQGGKIWFESTEGKGTTFYVVLPLN